MVNHPVPTPGFPINPARPRNQGRLEDRIANGYHHRSALIHLGLEAPTPFQALKRHADIAGNKSMADREKCLERGPNDHDRDRPRFQGEGLGPRTHRSRRFPLPTQGSSHSRQRHDASPKPRPVRRWNPGIAQPAERAGRPVGFQKNQSRGQAQQRKPNDVIEEDEMIDPMKDHHQHHPQKTGSPHQ